jgi:hypothetical protein
VDKVVSLDEIVDKADDKEDKWAGLCCRKKSSGVEEHDMDKEDSDRRIREDGDLRTLR